MPHDSDDHLNRRALTPMAVLSFAALSLTTLALGVAGCATPKPTTGERISISDAEQAAADRAFAREPFDDQVRAAVLRQRALFEYHFEVDSAVLNSLGRRDVGILAGAMSESGGRISVQRGSASKDLYAARLASVRAAVAAKGIPAKRVKLDDTGPGGNGVPTGEAIMIRARIEGTPMEIETGELLSSDSESSSTGGDE